MKIENERRFLVKSLPENWWQYPHSYIAQGYLAVAPNGNGLRIRKEGRYYSTALKIGRGQKRGEFQSEIAEKEFVNLWPATQNRRLWKIHCLIPCQEYEIELNVYRRHLQGFVLAEVEFASVDVKDGIKLSYFEM